MAGPSDERALATWLAARDDDDLRRLFGARGVSASSPWRGFFDAAESLLDEASVDRALRRVPRSALVALASGVPVPQGARASLQRLALIDADAQVYTSVRRRVDAAAAGLPDAFRPASAPTAPGIAGGVAAAAAAERALTAVATLADLLLIAGDTGIATTVAGTVAAGDRRRLMDQDVVADGDELEDVLASGRDARLITLVQRQWVVTPAGERWLPLSSVERWKGVAEGFRATLPPGLRSPDGGFVPWRAWGDTYPLDSDWPVRAMILRRRAVRWGLVDADGSEPPWGAALRTGATVDPAALSALLPPEIDRVYLQADLSAIAPGPLRSELDLRLRGMSQRESRAQASTYRFSAESLSRAVAGGETADSIRSFLTTLSLTGIPQPLDYLVDQAERSSGRIRVRWDAASARTRVDVDDATLRETIAVDRALRAVGLVIDGDELVSRAASEAVYWGLVDARYPAIAVDDDDAPRPVQRRSAAVADAPGRPDFASLIAALRSGDVADTDAAWLERELDQAVRARAFVDVVVQLPDGGSRSFTLEATGLGGGRLRGRDRAADVERTLPVSSIVSVRPVPEASRPADAR